jgi:membrane-associated protein
MIADSILNTLYHLLSIFDVEALIMHGGLLMICLLIYGNTGLFFCFFLPSGAILFGAGVFVATGTLDYDIVTVWVLLIAAAVLGNLTGYWFGRKAGPSLYRRKDSRFFRRQYLIKTEEFYKKHGGLALIAGVFLPIIRTFSPIVAGVIGLKLQRFIIAIITGSFLWVSFFVITGYFMGNRPWLKPWIKYIVIAVVLFITVPLVIRMVKELRKPGKENEDSG